MEVFVTFMYLLPAVGMLLALLVVCALTFLAVQGAREWLASREPAARTAGAAAEARVAS